VRTGEGLGWLERLCPPNLRVGWMLAWAAEMSLPKGEAMALHFDPAEFDARRRRVLEAMAAQGLDALLMFKQEKHVCWGFVAVPESC
jgi:hypothetical protein